MSKKIHNPPPPADAPKPPPPTSPPDRFVKEERPWQSLRPPPAMDVRVVDCKHCDGQCGSVATYAGQALIPINGRVRGIDWCIHSIVSALNAGGVETVASCCGHGTQDGRIDLADGRVLVVKASADGVS